MERVCEVWEDLFGCALSEGTLASWVQEAAYTLSPSLLILKELLMRSHIDHVDRNWGTDQRDLVLVPCERNGLAHVLFLASQAGSGCYG